MDNFVIENILWNTGLVAIAGFLIKSWMSKMEAGRDANAKAIAENDKELRAKLEKVTQETAVEIKDAIHRNLDVYRQSCGEIKISIDKLADQVTIANGRTRKNELDEAELRGKLNTQIALCQERRGDICKDSHRVD